MTNQIAPLYPETAITLLVDTLALYAGGLINAEDAGKRIGSAVLGAYKQGGLDHQSSPIRFTKTAYNV